MVGLQMGLDVHVLDRNWLQRLINRKETPENFQKAPDRKPDDIKVIIQFSDV
jgi:hypothetical protein